MHLYRRDEFVSGTKYLTFVFAIRTVIKAFEYEML